MPVHVLLVKLMEIEPLKTLSLLCSGGQLMSTQTETKPSQPVSLPFIIVRTTAAALPVSPQSPPSVCVCVCVCLCLCVSKNPTVSNCIFHKGGNLRWCEGDNARGKRGKQKTLLEGSKFYLGSERVARGSMAVFVFQMLAGKWAVVCISAWT